MSMQEIYDTTYERAKKSKINKNANYDSNYICEKKKILKIQYLNVTDNKIIEVKHIRKNKFLVKYQIRQEKFDFGNNYF